MLECSTSSFHVYWSGLCQDITVPSPACRSSLSAAPGTGRLVGSDREDSPSCGRGRRGIRYSGLWPPGHSLSQAVWEEAGRSPGEWKITHGPRSGLPPLGHRALDNPGDQPASAWGLSCQRGCLLSLGSPHLLLSFLSAMGNLFFLQGAVRGSPVPQTPLPSSDDFILERPYNESDTVRNIL